jgi:hypothetical protein
MKTRKIIIVLWVASVVGGCAQSSTVVTTPENRVGTSNGPNVSKGTTFMNGAQLPNGAILANGAVLANGANRAVALKALASRPLAKKN